MTHRKVYIRVFLLLVAVWVVVWAVRSYAAGRKVTAESVRKAMEGAGFADWSEMDSGGADSQRREVKLREIAAMVNRLDFQEREKNRRNRVGEDFFGRLNQAEKNLFIELTVRESMSKFMESLDAMPPEQRRKFVEQGLRELAEGRTAEDMERMAALDEELVRKVTEEGMRAYFEKSSTDTKLDLAPLMNAVNETMQGLRGRPFGPRSE